MTTPGERAVGAWRNLFGAHANGLDVPSADASRPIADAKDVADLLLATAGVFDALLNGEIVPDAALQDAMLNLLVTRDFVLPLPPDAGPQLDADFQAVLDDLRDGR